MPESFWRSLWYFNLYRLASAIVFVGAVALYGGSINLGAESPRLFLAAAATYAVVAILFFGLAQFRRLPFDLLLTLEVVADIACLTVMMHFSGGMRSGMSYTLLVVLAGAGLVGQGRLALFFSALATVAILLEHADRVLRYGADPGEFVQAGITSIGFFATAITARLLARRVVANEELANRRGAALAAQLRVGERIIHDMQDGILVVEGDGRVRQFNPRAETLLEVKAPADPDLAAFSPDLAEKFFAWHERQTDERDLLRLPGSGRLIRVRFLPAGEGDIALVYLEDLAEAQTQAQQLKLAALGRLTANLAHEIRNPLSAISQAAELLRSEKRGEMQARLTRIIGDNTQRLNRLVSEVLELGRRDRAVQETIPLAQFLAAFLEEFAIRDDRVRSAVAASIDPDVVVCFDRSHLNRVLWNLVVNALRYCSGGAGSVRVEARLHPSARHCELHVIDDGPGIEPGRRGQVFEPFFTTHGAGTGLGLYIARELCEANGASLEVVDESVGAHFRLTARGEPCPESRSEGGAATAAAS
ncbi:MAG: PAS domain-containing protein [Rhodocyclaceae bacterium]|nr:PAS domain-containing protein [Rhodocyclaceae bacterium]